jgi:hypothetical protein
MMTNRPGQEAEPGSAHVISKEALNKSPAQATPAPANDVSELEERLRSMALDYEALKQDLCGHLVALSLGLDTTKLALHRYVPIRVFISDPRQERAWADAGRYESTSRGTGAEDPGRAFVHQQYEREGAQLVALLRHLCAQTGIALVASLPAQSGSWFKKLYAKTTSPETIEALQERLQKAERALELATLHKSQADVDKTLAEAAALLIKQLENVSRAACQLGSVVVLKYNDDAGRPMVIVRNLTQRQLAEVEQNQDLLCEPEYLLRRLCVIDGGVLNRESDDGESDSERPANRRLQPTAASLESSRRG